MARNNVARLPARAQASAEPKRIRCAIYTRKSTEEGLQQEFNSLDAQREASEAFVASQKQEGWQLITDHFDDGGYTGGNMDRNVPAQFSIGRFSDGHLWPVLGGRRGLWGRRAQTGARCS